jgi:DNA-binding transcriptional MerR regulator
MKIGEVARAAGVSVDTLRFYDRRGLLTPDFRTAAGYRDYDDDAPARVAEIKSLQAVGLSLEDIGQVLAGDARACVHVEPPLTRVIESLEARIAELESLRVRAMRARDACRNGECDRAGGCTSRSC